MQTPSYTTNISFVDKFGRLQSMFYLNFAEVLVAGRPKAAALYVDSFVLSETLNHNRLSTGE